MYCFDVKINSDTPRKSELGIRGCKPRVTHHDIRYIPAYLKAEVAQLDVSDLADDNVTYIQGQPMHSSGAIASEAQTVGSSILIRS